MGVREERACRYKEVSWTGKLPVPGFLLLVLPHFLCYLLVKKRGVPILVWKKLPLVSGRALNLSCFPGVSDSPDVVKGTSVQFRGREVFLGCLLLLCQESGNDKSVTFFCWVRRHKTSCYYYVVLPDLGSQTSSSSYYLAELSSGRLLHHF